MVHFSKSAYLKLEADLTKVLHSQLSVWSWSWLMPWCLFSCYLARRSTETMFVAIRNNVSPKSHAIFTPRTEKLHNFGRKNKQAHCSSELQALPLQSHWEERRGLYRYVIGFNYMRLSSSPEIANVMNNWENNPSVRFRFTKSSRGLTAFWP